MYDVQEKISSFTEKMRKDFGFAEETALGLVFVNELNADGTMKASEFHKARSDSTVATVVQMLGYNRPELSYSFYTRDGALAQDHLPAGYVADGVLVVYKEPEVRDESSPYFKSGKSVICEVMCCFINRVLFQRRCMQREAVK